MSLSAGQDYVLGRREGRIDPSEPPAVSYRGEGDDCVDRLDATFATLLADWAKGRKGAKSGYAKDAVEGQLAVVLYKGLVDLPADVLTDRDFWRYLATAYLFDFTGWRDGEDCQLRSFGCERQNPGWDCVPLRMFNRALISCAGAQTDDEFWGARVAGTDLWRSHILRVLNGNAPVFVNEVLREVDNKRLPSDVLREFALGARRIRANVLFELLDADQASDLVESERTRAEAALDARSNSG